MSVFVTRCVAAIDLTYGVVLCFACHDYVYCDEVDTVVQSQRQLTGTSLGLNEASTAVTVEHTPI